MKTHFILKKKNNYFLLIVIKKHVKSPCWCRWAKEAGTQTPKHKSRLQNRKLFWKIRQNQLGRLWRENTKSKTGDSTGKKQHKWPESTKTRRNEDTTSQHTQRHTQETRGENTGENHQRWQTRLRCWKMTRLESKKQDVRQREYKAKWDHQNKTGTRKTTNDDILMRLLNSGRGEDQTGDRRQPREELVHLRSLYQRVCCVAVKSRQVFYHQSRTFSSAESRNNARKIHCWF